MRTQKIPCNHSRSTAISRRFAIAGLIAFSGLAITASPALAISPSDLVRQLINASWPAAAATNVASVQSPIQTQIALADPALAESRLEKLKELAKYPVAMRLMISHPHWAGFIMHAADPMQAAETLASTLYNMPVISITQRTYIPGSWMRNSDRRNPAALSSDITTQFNPVHFSQRGAHQ